ncbi:MAG: hypothetical protein LM550_14020 [Candidatus Contendobacter sp.]|jgi:hypothetical protein|nr:hypothetical protein [Gammaproteobacteria bacterium]MCC8994769.1 hypothetical protein [Candidatus Contendobacter sp.]
MIKQESAQFTIYEAEAMIPGHQRAWVWGIAALAILLCGLVAGWLLGGTLNPYPFSASTTDSARLLIRQEAINQQLRERIAGLEQALGSDVCGLAALKALPPDRK